METRKEKILDKALNGEWVTSEEIKEFVDNSKEVSNKSLKTSLKSIRRIPSNDTIDFKSGEEMWQYAKKRNPKI